MLISIFLGINFLKINIRQKCNTNKDGTYFKLLLTYFGYPFAFVISQREEDKSLPPPSFSLSLSL